ncbi:MAG: hypothetical protein M1148_02500 [Candidatus Thermoplasmatota archaeon]|nr:hypothetical protein [Candidatus Thermoplasmatota archaeon]MCL5438051.1 hypothetical protein [Candidatus Thermoplasmatota archaeon]
MIAVLISFTMEYKGRSRAEISKFYRDLYGYESFSHYGRYRSRKEGFLDSVKNIRYSKGLFMVRKEDEKKVLYYLRKKGAKTSKWIVVPGKKEIKRLGLQAV